MEFWIFLNSLAQIEISMFSFELYLSNKRFISSLNSYEDIWHFSLDIQFNIDFIQKVESTDFSKRYSIV